MKNLPPKERPQAAAKLAVNPWTQCLGIVVKSSFLLAALFAVFGSALVYQGEAQTLTVLHNFSAMSTNSKGVYTNWDGASVNGSLILSGNTLYGTASHGGALGLGAIFSINTDGAGFTNLHNFGASSGPNDTNVDGSYPFASLVLSSNTLYGTTDSGGSSGFGTVFAINTDGTSYRNLYGFTTTSRPNYTNVDGANPEAGLTLWGNTLYGTGSSGGEYGYGALFAVNTDGSGFRNLHSFTSFSCPSPCNTNSDGAWISAGLVFSGNTLYGTAGYGGIEGNGTVFGINPDGTGFTNLHNFNYVGSGEVLFFQSSAALVSSGNSLYGTKSVDGTTNMGPNYGTVFRMNTDGSGFTTLYSFANGADGSGPFGGVILSDNTLYGTTVHGGRWGVGTIFAINADGTRFVTLHDFRPTSGPDATNVDGDSPTVGLVVSGRTLYGVTGGGGSYGAGTIFSLTLPGPPQLTITSANDSVVLIWPTNATGFILQSTTNLGPAAAWITNSQVSAVVNGQNTVTNAIAPKQQFFRLSQ